MMITELSPRDRDAAKRRAGGIALIVVNLFNIQNPGLSGKKDHFDPRENDKKTEFLPGNFAILRIDIFQRTITIFCP